MLGNRDLRRDYWDKLSSEVLEPVILKANWNEWASENKESKQQELTAVSGMAPHPDQGFYYCQGDVVSLNLAESSRSIKA